MLDINLTRIPIETQCRPKVLTRWSWVILALQTIDLYVTNPQKLILERELFWLDYTDSAAVGDLAVIRTCRLTVKTIYCIYGGNQWQL